MTLTKAVEAAREALKRNIVCMEGNLDGSAMIHAETKQALAALPEKPMTEQEIHDLVYPDILAFIDKEELTIVIRALKAANVLYVEEK